jgi:GrpB-like predicted nucleotidyltransferase (UPF0157 family)
MNKRELEQEFEKLRIRYDEEHKKYEELLSQIVSLASLEPGKEIKVKRTFYSALKEKKEAEQNLDKLRREMNEAGKRLYDAYHKK